MISSIEQSTAIALTTFRYPGQSRDIHEGCVLIHPVHSNIKVNVSLIEVASPKTDLYLGTLTCDTYVNLLELPGIPESDCVLQLTVFLVSDGYDEDPDSKYGEEICADHCILGTYRVHKVGRDCKEKFIDTGVDMVDISFMFEDKLVALAEFEGILTPTSGGKGIKIKRTTDESGSIYFPLPPGYVNATVKREGRDIVISQRIGERGRHTELRADSGNCQELSFLVDCSTIMKISKYHTKARPILLLGDVSGSMRARMNDKTRLDYMKDTLKYFCRQAVEHNLKMCFALWSSWVYYPPDVGECPYVTVDNLGSTLEWIDKYRIDPKGAGNNLRYALEDVLRVYSDIADV